MILGLGIDVAHPKRIAQSLAKRGEQFIRRIGHPDEIKAAPRTEPRRSQYWAARFAAKEAFAKALGTGIGSKVKFSAVGLVKTKSGKPHLVCSTELRKILKARGITSAHVSITHTQELAAAVIVLEGIKG